MSGERYSLGTCRYCGQVVNLERERDSQEAADIAASEECSCYDAREERAIRRKIENAQDRIQKVFGSEAEELGFRPINAPEPIQLMNDIAVLILVHKAAGNVVGLDPLETVYLRERPLEVAGRDTPDLLLAVEHANGGLALEIILSEGKRVRRGLLPFDFPEYRLTAPASGVLECHADDPEYLPV